MDFTKVFFCTFLISCGHSSPETDIKIDAGIHITGESANSVPGVMSIGGCTSTAVSDNTLITAAHCVSVGSRVCIRSGSTSNGSCSTATFVPSRFQANNWQKDIAVVVFPTGTFKYFFQVQTKSIQAKDRFELMANSAAMKD